MIRRLKNDYKLYGNAKVPVVVSTWSQNNERPTEKRSISRPNKDRKTLLSSLVNELEKGRRGRQRSENPGY